MTGRPKALASQNTIGVQSALVGTSKKSDTIKSCSNSLRCLWSFLSKNGMTLMRSWTKALGGVQPHTISSAAMPNSSSLSSVSKAISPPFLAHPAARKSKRQRSDGFLARATSCGGHSSKLAPKDECPPQDVALARKPSDRCRLLFLAAGWARKGGDIAFETLLKLEELGIAAELIVCGCTPPKAFVHERMRVIPFLDKNDQRQRRELEQLFMVSDFLLLPTRADCTPMVFCEANAFGLPVITTDTGGVSEVVRDGENGFLLPYEARGADYAEVVASLYRDEQRYVQLARTSRAAFESRLNWDAWGVAVKHILADLLGHESSRSQRIEVRPKKVEDISVEDISVEEFIPTSIQPLIDAYLHALEPLRSHFYGIYIYGSIAFGAFEELESDIDILALTHG